MTWEQAHCRDTALACLAALHDAADAYDAADASDAAELSHDLQVLRDRDIGRVLGEMPDESLLGIPGWLWDEPESALQMILSAATEPPRDAATDLSAPATVARLLGDTVTDLLDLSAKLAPPAPDRKERKTPPSYPTVILTTAGDRCVATSLWPLDDAGAEDPWLRPADPPRGAAAAVRRAFSAFESLADQPIDLDLGAGYLWPAQIIGQPVLGLHSALVALARTAGLSAMPASLVAIGDSDDNGVFTALPDEQVAAYAAAVGHLDCAILVPVSQGWQLTSPDGTVRMATGSRHDLDAVAALVWGDAWAAWKRQQHRRELVLLGWTPVDPTQLPPNQLIPETDVSQVNQLFAGFHEALQQKLNTVIVLGGTQSSGKTVIVHRLVSRIAQQKKNPPLTRIIASTTHELPNREVGLRVGRHALGMDEAVGAQRRLLILEDLHPVGDGNVDELLPYLSRALGTSILGVLQYDVNSNEEWQTDHLHVVTAVVGREAMRTFVEELCRAHPDRLSRSAGLAELDRPRPPADVRRLIQIMLRPDGVVADGTQRPEYDEMLTDRFMALDGATREAVATTAAWSMARGWSSHDLLDLLSPEEVTTFGLESSADSGKWRVTSPENCRTVLTAYRASQGPQQDAPVDATGKLLHPLDATIVDLVLPELLSVLQEGSPQSLTMLRGIRLHRNAAAAEVVKRAWDDRALRHWIRQAHPAKIAELLVSFNVWLSEDVFRDCVQTLLRRLSAQTENFTVQETLITLRCLRAYLSEITSQWRPVSDWIRNQVVGILINGSGSPGERFQLLRRTESFYDPVLQQVIVEHAADALPGLDGTQADDYYLIRRICVLQSRAERAFHKDQKWYAIEQEPAVLSLLDAEPPQNVGFHVVLGWLSLRQYFKHATWELLLDEHEHRFAPSMRYTSAHEFSRALNELHKHGTSRVNAIFMRALRHDPRRKVQERQPFFDAIRKLLLLSTPIEAAEMIRSVAVVHAHAAYTLLYPHPDVPDDDLAARMADRVVEMADTKGAGMLLSVTQSIDEIYTVRSTGFAHRFGSHLGEERVRRMLREDPRPSVKYYLIKGLFDAQVPFRRECLSVVRDTVVEAITRGRKAWGPRLALQLGSDVEIGRDFLLDLRDHISLRNILDGMDRYTAPDAQAQYHRLGRALYPEAANQYALAFDVDEFLGPLAAAAPVSAVECCREVGRTLADADYPDGGRAIVRAADRVTGEPNPWTSRLARTRTGEHLAQVLNILMDIDRPTARSAVAALGERTVRANGEENESLLVWKARQSVFDSVTAAISLCKTLEDADAGLGALIYEHLRQEPMLLQVMTYELQTLQSASDQYVAVRQLAAIGVLSDRSNTMWMEQNFQAKLPLIPHRASPKVLADIIGMFAIGKPTWADRAIRAIDFEKLAARLRVDLSRDLAPAVRLAALLFDLDSQDASARIVASLDELEPGAVIRRLDLRDASVLLDLVGKLLPKRVNAFSYEIQAAIGSQLSRPIVLNERDQWMEIGYACHALYAAGAAITVTDAPRVIPNLAHYPAVAWGLHRLPDSAWSRPALTRATDRLFSRTPSDRTTLFTMLATAAGSGRLSDVSHLIGEDSRIEGLSFRQLHVLHELAEQDTALASLLATAGEEIRQTLTTPVARISWDAQRLVASLARLAQQGDGSAQTA